MIFVLNTVSTEIRQGRKIPSPLVTGQVRTIVVRPVMFQDPTPYRTNTTENYVYVNITTNQTADWAYLEWNDTTTTNATNFTMSGSGTHFYLNMTNLENRNYTFQVYANLSGKIFISLFSWVNVSYFPPPPAPPAPPAPAPEPAPKPPVPLPPEVYKLTGDRIDMFLDMPIVRITGDLVKPIFGGTIEIKTINCTSQTHFLEGDERFYLCMMVDSPIKDREIENLTITFRSLKSWIVQNNVNTTSIHLARDRYGRENLETRPINSDQDYVYFESESPGLSTFMIIGQILPEPEPAVEIPKVYCGDGYCDRTIGENCGNCPQDCACPSGEICVRSTCIPECEAFGIRGKFLNLCWWWWVIITLAAVLAAELWLRIKKSRKRSLYRYLLRVYRFAVSCLKRKFRKNEEEKEEDQNDF